MLSKKDHLLYLDTKDDSFALIPTNEKMKPYKIAIFFSGLERSLANSKYNLRQDECKAAAYALMGYAGMDYGTFADARLRCVPSDVFETYKDRLPELWRRRAEHYYSEFARAEAGAELWSKGDLEGYGQLVFASGKSSIENYECGCDELKKLYEIMTRTKGIYGGRFSGAGFKGCCMALISLDEAKMYLRVDSADEDAVISSLLSASCNLCADVARLTADQWADIDSGKVRSTRYTDAELRHVRETMKVAILYALGYLFEHREDADHHDLTLTLRSLLFGIREGVIS